MDDIQHLNFWKNMEHTKEQLQQIYFGFYDQLPEPYRSQAKENWDYKHCKNSGIPDTISEAIDLGFDWEVSKQEYEYWNNFFIGKNTIQIDYKSLCSEMAEVLEVFAHPDFTKILSGNTERDESIIFQREWACLKISDFKKVQSVLIKYKEATK